MVHGGRCTGGGGGMRPGCVAVCSWRRRWASRCASLQPSPSRGGGAHRLLTTSCPPCLAHPYLPSHPSFPSVGCANGAPGLSLVHCSVSGPCGGGGGGSHQSHRWSAGLLTPWTCAGGGHQGHVSEELKGVKGALQRRLPAVGKAVLGQCTAGKNRLEDRWSRREEVCRADRHPKERARAGAPPPPFKRQPHQGPYTRSKLRRGRVALP